MESRTLKSCGLARAPLSSSRGVSGSADRTPMFDVSDSTGRGSIGIAQIRFAGTLGGI